MELKLVYRILRALSDRALDFYSEVHVEGTYNVPADGPLIVVSCHHNEILDIATLAVTIPHRRPLCFWAKSSLFKNPLTRAILVSSGSIPVRRHPNGAASTDWRSTSSANGGGSDARQALFQETFRALDGGDGGAVGVFPEGTSYTEPRIVQVKEGAAWAALEYLRWKGQGGEEGRLAVVPVGIVHTAKARYQSRMAVRWGAPIDVASFAREHNAPFGTDEELRVAVKKLTEEIEWRMVGLTINAPDWNGLYVAKVARDMLWSDEHNIPMQQFPEVSQALVDLFSMPNPPASLPRARKSLLTYHSLLHYSNISHAHLTALLPNLRQASLPRRRTAVSLVFRQLLLTVLHPRFLLFLPPLLLHIPAYALAAAAKRGLASQREEETHAQYKAIFGMLGAGAVYGILGSLLARVVGRLPILATLSKAVARSDGGLQVALKLVEHAGVWLAKNGGGLRDCVVLIGSVYMTAKVLSRWHNILVGANMKQAQCLVTALKVSRGTCSTPSSGLSAEQLGLYGTPPEPPLNPFIKRRPSPDDAPKHATKVFPARMPPSWKFIRPLLEVRTEASYALSEYLADLEMHAVEGQWQDSSSTPALLHRLRQLGACF
ncbi:hypothetical protein DAEQUDRAFT_179796 [Daedalea quercina L-15889]|uniref:Phospholipid/glycerol acyltransferase domain-containing protein n=1 Tax=Daedalea quercina L-15889 TaxID=1314783 RepID=A0A165REA8_9APHY|nr:hypothetical protein DAEQUDRAFT_179796 [Daedalea quercina L-15889]